MSSEHAASSAAVASCAGGGTLTILVSTDTIITTLPWVTQTLYKVFEYTLTESDGIGPTTSKDVLTVSVRSTPFKTKFELVTYTRCIGEVLMAPTTSMDPSTLSSMVSTPTAMATPSEASTGPQHGDNKTLLITATVGSISIVFILVTALGFWMRWRTRRKKLELVSHKDITEAASSSLFPGRDTHKKLSVGTTIDGTASTNPTLVDYVGLMPSVSQRNLVGPATDVQSAVDTDWSNVRRPSIAPLSKRVHGINSQYLRPKRVSTRPSRDRHPYTANYNSSYPRDGSVLASQMPTAKSYTSRGTSAFLPPVGGVRAQSGEISSGPSQDHLLPTVYSPDTVRSAVPVQEGGDEILFSQPDSDDHFPRSPSREWAWAEALRRLESIHDRRPVDFTRGPTGDNQVTVTRNEFDRQHEEESAMSEGDYETIMYESEGESRARSMRGPGRDNTDESVFSVDAVVRRIANEPPRERVRR
ncbi:hypothetical protein VE03_03300 [Pseudogymnoascus sp. 23342-1-I1]|nr:hypothetical protein VE03_03300 [Pseudogymnoascus sp. 23342-1-I1]